MTDGTDDNRTSSPEVAQTSRSQVSDEQSRLWAWSARLLATEAHLVGEAGLLPGVRPLTEAESQALEDAGPNDPRRQRLLIELGLVVPPRTEPARNPSSTNPASTPRPSIVQIEAAKLRLVTDRRLGKKSPQWLKRVAKGLPAQPERSVSHTMTATD